MEISVVNVWTYRNHLHETYDDLFTPLGNEQYKLRVKGRITGIAIDNHYEYEQTLGVEDLEKLYGARAIINTFVSAALTYGGSCRSFDKLPELMEVMHATFAGQ